MYWQIVDNKQQLVLHMALIIGVIALSSLSWNLFGAANGLQVGLISATIIVGVYSYGKQVKSTIRQSVERLPEIEVDGHVIKAIVFGIKLWGPVHTTLQFKLYEKKDDGLYPANMEEFLNAHFENPTEEFNDVANIANQTDVPPRVNIEREPFLDPEGLRIRTTSLVSVQIRRLSEQTMRKISERVDETVEEKDR